MGGGAKAEKSNNVGCEFRFKVTFELYSNVFVVSVGLDLN